MLVFTSSTYDTKVGLYGYICNYDNATKLNLEGGGALLRLTLPQIRQKYINVSKTLSYGKSEGVKHNPQPFFWHSAWNLEHPPPPKRWGKLSYSLVKSVLAVDHLRVNNEIFLNQKTNQINRYRMLS